MRRRGTRGQSLAEMGIVVVMLVLLVSGVAEVGWAFARANMIMHAARDGARYGATFADDRDVNTGCFTDTQDIQDHVESALATVGFTADGVTVSQGCDVDVPIITVTVTGTLENFFFFLGDGSFAVDRAVTFQDEGRQSGNCCT